MKHYTEEEYIFGAIHDALIDIKIIEKQRVKCARWANFWLWIIWALLFVLGLKIESHIDWVEEQATIEQGEDYG